MNATYITHTLRIHINGFSALAGQDLLYALFNRERTAHTPAYDGPVVDHWLEQKIAQTANAPAMQARSDDPNLYR